MLSGVEGEGWDVVWIEGIADEATGSVRVESEEEEEGEVVSVPKGLEALVTNFAVSGRVYEEHDEEHEVAGDAAGLGVVDVEGSLCANLCRGVRDSRGSGGTYG
jgi:hypothetical protein